MSGLFTTEFYGRIKDYLTPNGVFAQWLHLYEIDDGLILGVISALSQHFPTYSIFQISNKDILIVATAARRPAGARLVDLQVSGDRRGSEARVADHAEHDGGAARSRQPLAGAADALAGVPNSDFYPTLDLNAERTRFMKSEATGFEGLTASRVNFAAMVDGRRNGLGDSYAVVFGVPRLNAMAVAAGAETATRERVPTRASRRRGGRCSTPRWRPARAPMNWHVWVQSVASVEAALHGGMAGVVDTAFYASLRRYLDKTNAPELPRAAVISCTVWRRGTIAEASHAADPLLAAAGAGDLWVDADMLRDGAVMAKLATGDPRRAPRVQDADRAVVAKHHGSSNAPAVLVHRRHDGRGGRRRAWRHGRIDTSIRDACAPVRYTRFVAFVKSAAVAL